jgi:hypothetical protein
VSEQEHPDEDGEVYYEKYTPSYDGPLALVWFYTYPLYLPAKSTREECQNEIHELRALEYHQQDERAPVVKVDIGEVGEDI